MAAGDKSTASYPYLEVMLLLSLMLKLAPVSTRFIIFILLSFVTLFSLMADVDLVVLFLGKFESWNKVQVMNTFGSSTLSGPLTVACLTFPHSMIQNRISSG